MGGLSVLNKQLRAFKLSLKCCGSIVPEHFTAVCEWVVGKAPVDAVVRQSMDSSMILTAYFPGHVFEDGFIMIILPPCIGIFDVGFRAVESVEGVGAGATVGAFPVVGDSHSKF